LPPQPVNTSGSAQTAVITRKIHRLRLRSRPRIRPKPLPCSLCPLGCSFAVLALPHAVLTS
jgi:hypothetical protein